MKPNKQIIIDAIIKEIKLGKGFKAVFEVIRSKSKLAESTFASYWKIANKQHSSVQQAIKDQLAKISTEAAIDADRMAIMTANQRKEYLTKIINGSIEITQKQMWFDRDEGKMKIIPISNPPNIAERIRAIAELNRMDGDYASTKIDVKGKIEVKQIVGMIVK